MKKTLTTLITGTLLGISSLFAQNPEPKIVNLPAGITDFRNTTLPMDTIYDGGLPEKRIEEIKYEIVSGKLENNPSMASEIFDIDYAVVLLSQTSLGARSEIRNCQIRTEGNGITYTEGANRIENNLCIGNGGVGFSLGNHMYMINNVFIGFGRAYYNDARISETVLWDNIFAWCDVAVYGGARINIGSEGKGDNTFWKNEMTIAYNGDEVNIDSERAKAENNWWYDKDGKLLETEEEILATTNRPQGTLRTIEQEVMNPIDVVPFRTDNPYITSASGWEFY